MTENLKQQYRALRNELVDIATAIPPTIVGSSVATRVAMMADANNDLARDCKLLREESEWLRDRLRSHGISTVPNPCVPC